MNTLNRLAVIADLVKGWADTIDDLAGTLRSHDMTEAFALVAVTDEMRACSNEIVATGIVADDKLLTEVGRALYPAGGCDCDSCLSSATESLQTAALKLSGAEWDAVWTAARESKLKLNSRYGKTYNCRRLAAEHAPHKWVTADGTASYYCEGESTRRLAPPPSDDPREEATYPDRLAQPEERHHDEQPEQGCRRADDGVSPRPGDSEDC